MSENDRFPRRLRWIALAALVLRFAAAWELAAINGGRNSVFAPSAATDLATYMELGRAIARGVFPPEFYYQPFYYAVFLPVVYLISGGSTVAVIVFQAVLGAATVWLAGRIGAALWSRRAGLWAAGLTAVSTPLLLYTPFSQNETLQTFWIALLLACVLRLRKSPGWNMALGTGLVAGAAILTRGNAWCFVPGLVWAVLAGRWRNGRSWRDLGIAVAALLVLQLPFAAYNTRARGRVTGPSTAADAVLALGNTPEAPAGGRNPGLPAGPMEYPDSYQDFMARAAAGESVPRQMLGWMRREPGAFFELQFRKILLFWDYREIPNNVSLYGEGVCSRVLRWLLPGRSGVLVALGVAGMLLAAARAFRRRSAPLGVLYWWVLSYAGATAAFYILSRFRAPILPVLAVFGGIFIDRALRMDRHAQLTRALPALAFGVWLTFGANDLYRECEPAIFRLVRPDGTRMTFRDGRRIFLDHGPFTGGGWTVVDLVPGQRLTKLFPGADADAATVRWQIAAEPGTRLTFRANGKTFSAEAGGAPVVFVAPLPAGRLELEILEVSGNAGAIVDRQRQYGRSGDLAGELVIRAEISRAD